MPNARYITQKISDIASGQRKPQSGAVSRLAPLSEPDAWAREQTTEHLEVVARTIGKELVRRATSPRPSK